MQFVKGMAMEERILAVVGSANIHTRRKGKIGKHIMGNDTETLVHAFVSSDLITSMAYLSGVPKKLTSILQWIQNTVACLVLRSKSSSHITSKL